MTDDKPERRELGSRVSLPLQSSNPVINSLATDLISVVYDALESGESIDQIIESPAIREQVANAQAQLSAQGDEAPMELTELIVATLACALSEIALADIAVDEKPPPLPASGVAPVKRAELLLITADDTDAKLMQRILVPEFEVTIVDRITQDTVRLAANVQWAHVVVDVDMPDAHAFALRALDMGACVAVFSRGYVSRELRYQTHVLAYPFDATDRFHFVKPSS
jgi:hypothetical protein